MLGGIPNTAIYFSYHVNFCIYCNTGVYVACATFGSCGSPDHFKGILSLCCVRMSLALGKIRLGKSKLSRSFPCSEDIQTLRERLPEGTSARRAVEIRTAEVPKQVRKQKFVCKSLKCGKHLDVPGEQKTTIVHCDTVRNLGKHRDRTFWQYPPSASRHDETR